MKRKKISLLCALLSLAVAFTYVALAIVLTFRVISAKEYVPTADADLWVIKVLQRLKAAGFNIFFSIMGVVLSSMLALYRIALAYFYNKVSKSDEVFYKARIGEIVLYSVLSAFVIGATAWLSFGGKGVLPLEIQPFISALFIVYLLLFVLPLLEIAFVYFAKLFVPKPKQAVVTKKDVMQELDELADKTALEIAKKQEEKKVQTPVHMQPVLQVATPTKVRKVIEYVTPYWDKEDESATDENKTLACTKVGIRKKNRKPSYNSAILRIKKPLSNRQRNKIMSPSVRRLRYYKTCRFERYDAKNRK